MTFGFGVNLSGVTLFDEIDREYFDRVELISMPGEKTISLCFEDSFGVPGIVALRIPGVVSLGVASGVALDIPGVVSFGFPRFIFLWISW